jgi:hypothetical protein
VLLVHQPCVFRRVPARLVATGLVAVTIATTTLSTVPEAQAQPSPTPAHRPPVAAPVADAFRPPPHPFGPGNRGIEYDTAPGTVVEASADGEVVFAGEVAGTRHVTVLHADGVRTSYSFLEAVTVVRGQRVRQGDRVGVAGERLHFGARRGDAYFDPASLFGATTTRVELLPFEVPPGASRDEERAALVALLFGRDGGIGLPDLGEVAGWLTSRATAAGRYTLELHPVPRGARLARDLVGRLLSPQDCTWRPPPPRPATRRARLAVLVGGLGSSSESASVDELRLDDLGYDERDVVRFSYRGGRTPGSGGAFASLAPRAYASADTQGDLRASAARLADALAAVMTERPGTAVDVYAHSMGGVVVRLALAELVRRGVDLRPLGVVATLGTPHRGADLATATAAANLSLTGRAALGLADAVLDTGIDADAPAVRQLAEDSDVTDELQASGSPPGVELVSLAAAGDRVVASPQTEVTGARNVTVGVLGPGAHGDLVASDAATDEMARALAGMPPACESLLGALGEEVLGHGTSYAEDLGGAGLANLPG